MIAAHTDGAVVTGLSFDAAPLSTGSVSLDRDNPRDHLIIRYTDDRTTVADLPYSVRWTLGDGDGLLEPGELAEITVDTTGISPPIVAGTRFELDLIAGGGSVVSVERTMAPGRPLNPLVRLP